MVFAPHADVKDVKEAAESPSNPSVGGGSIVPNITNTPPQAIKPSFIKTLTTRKFKPVSEGPIHVPRGKVISGWRIVSKLGEGSCGSVYKVQHTIDTNRFAAMKAEVRNAAKGNVLKFEVKVLERLSGKPLMPQIYNSGKRSEFDYVIMSLYGDTLSNLIRRTKSKQTSICTQVRIGIHVLAGLKYLHDAGFVHRDVKPANLLMGVEGTGDEKFVHVMDFGLAREFVMRRPGVKSDVAINKQYFIRPPRNKAYFRGTVRYCSIATHEQREQGRVDDLWSLVYTLAEFRTVLPWFNFSYDMKNRIKDLKKVCTDEILFSNSPAHFLKITAHLRKIGYYDRPDYKLIYDVLMTVMRLGEYTFELPYEWSRNQEPSPPLCLEDPTKLPPLPVVSKRKGQAKEADDTSTSAPLTKHDALLASVSNRNSMMFKTLPKSSTSKRSKKADRQNKSKPADVTTAKQPEGSEKEKALKKVQHESSENRNDKNKPSKMQTPQLIFPGLSPISPDLPEVRSPYSPEHFIVNTLGF